MFLDLHDGAGNEPFDEFYDNDMSANLQDYGNFDQVNGNGASSDVASHALGDVLLGYLGGNKNSEHPDYDDRGLEGLDPADVLDGMMCGDHMTQMQAEALLHDAMDYNYDFDPQCD